MKYDVRNVERRLYKLKPLDEVRAVLGVTGEPGSWVLNGDGDVMDLGLPDMPF